MLQILVATTRSYRVGYVGGWGREMSVGLRRRIVEGGVLYPYEISGITGQEFSGIVNPILG